MSTTMLRDGDMRAVLLAILVVSAAAWWALLAPVPAAFICGAPGGEAWSVARAANLAGMWAVMTVAMMLPAAAPAIARAAWHRRRDAPVAAGALCFAWGYLGVMLGAGLVAAGLEWGLEAAGLMRAGAAAESPALRGLLLLLAGLCWLRSRADTGESCVGETAPLLAGARHGHAGVARCVAMACLQFAAGAMNPAWMVLVTGWMLIEAALPWRERARRCGGFGLLAAGGLCLVQGLG